MTNRKLVIPYLFGGQSRYLVVPLSRYPVVPQENTTLSRVRLTTEIALFNIFCIFVQLKTL